MGENKMKTHELKLDTEFFDAVLNKEKTFEIRLNDRGFQKGDYLIFKETKSGTHYARYRKATANITYVLNGWGLENGYVAFGITNVIEVDND